MSGRAIPYMMRNTADEFRRRRQTLLNCFWSAVLFPLYFAALFYTKDDE